MRHTTRSSLYATVAISAALAFGSTPAFGQDAAAPPLEVPQAASPPAAPTPQPTIVLPRTTAPAAEAPAQEPAAKPSPAPRAERAAPRPAARTAARSAEPAVAPQPASAPVGQAAPVAPQASQDVPPPVPVAAPVPFEPEPVDPRREDSVRSAVDLPDELLVAMGLGVIALGGIGLVNLRRRRREQALYDEVYEPEPEYVAEAPVTSIPDELAIRPAQPVSAMAANGQSFAMPEGPIPTGEARQQLIDAMVAAPPDEANPFTSLKSRRKRARIILQSREQELREQATQPFDWRTYKSPASVDPATPPMVDA